MNAHSTELPLPFAPTLEVAGEPKMHMTLTTMDDAPRLFEAIEDNRRYLEEYQWWCQDIRALQHAEAHNRRALIKMAEGDWLQYRINPGRIGAPEPWVGAVTLYDHNPLSHTVKFGYWLTEEAQGNGYAVRGTRRLLEYGREVLGITRAVAHIAKGNDPSEALAEKLGCRIVESYPAKIDDDGEGRVVMVRTWVKDLQEAA